jgi:hypothetical protein
MIATPKDRYGMSVFFPVGFQKLISQISGAFSSSTGATARM